MSDFPGEDVYYEGVLLKDISIYALMEVIHSLTWQARQDFPNFWEVGVSKLLSHLQELERRINTTSLTINVFPQANRLYRILRDGLIMGKGNTEEIKKCIDILETLIPKKTLIPEES